MNISSHKKSMFGFCICKSALKIAYDKFSHSLGTKMCKMRSKPDLQSFAESKAQGFMDLL